MQLFLPNHYAAFDLPKPTTDDRVTRRERQDVRDVFLNLDSFLWPYINSKGWDLHRHRQQVHYVSSDHFIYLADGTPIVEEIDGMWLHYGKSPEQLDFLKTLGGYDYHKKNTDDYYNAFYLHTRIQFYINDHVFRAWLLLATDKNYYDRSEFLKRMRNPTDCNRLYQLIIPLLGQGFFYEIDSIRLQLRIGLTQDELIKFVRKDKGDVYSGIVKEYSPDEPSLSRDNIVVEMQHNLDLLYPLYNFMAWRPHI